RKVGGLRSIERNLCQDRLQIGRVKGWITLPKESGLTTAVPHWKRCLILPDAWNDYVITQIPPDTRKILNDIDSGMVQFTLIADARLHEQLGRVDRAERKHNSAASGNPMRPPAAKEFYFCRPPAMEYNARYERVREHSEIVAVHVGIGIAAKHRQAVAVANADGGNRRPAPRLPHFPILVVDNLHPN